MTPKTLLDVVSEFTNISLDTMIVEKAREYPTRTFVNATSNQAIVYGWLLQHPESISSAIDLLKKDGKDLQLHQDDENAYMQAIINTISAICVGKMIKENTTLVSLQTLPSMCYDAEKTYESALGLVRSCEALGVSRDQLVIKIPTTWEAMQAAKRLTEEHNVRCLGTVVHSLAQAIVAAEAGCAIISPYVDDLEVNLDPSSYVAHKNLSDNYGYSLTKQIHYYYRAHKINTVLCAAALIGLDVVQGLAGIDEMTVPVITLEKMKNTEAPENFQPGVPATVAPQDAEPKTSYINDRESYYKAVNCSPEAVRRIRLAVDTFMDFDAKTRQYIKSSDKWKGAVSEIRAARSQH